MAQQPKYFIVESSMLPEVFCRVAEAKRLLESGGADTIQQAVAAAGISRSAFYKYRDAVHPFSDMLHGRIVTLQSRLRDEPGVLSSVLSLLASSGANILTINQSIPVNGCAPVTIGVETSGLRIPVEELVSRLAALSGVLECGILAG